MIAAITARPVLWRVAWWAGKSLGGSVNSHHLVSSIGDIHDSVSSLDICLFLIIIQKTQPERGIYQF